MKIENLKNLARFKSKKVNAVKIVDVIFKIFFHIWLSLNYSAELFVSE